ncbi:hypothetical protein EMPS_05471 [Entomortierella parvispora]|uniref:Uncharacterized protein n=1 Tax=Entomortierella parvispora TaxID=205924 RepID=A0A9P3HB30_9FUNG|nr:hypothetical protein EMPS_05471 [Entomortierella parvispora]
MESTTLWHAVPGRLQSVAVANKDSIWGVTLDQQLCKLNPETKQWQLVSITTESVNRSRFSSSSAGSALSTSVSSSSSLATKKLASILPSLGLQSLNSNPTTPNPNMGDDDENCESTVLVSAATDGTVVRLDGSFKAWYLIAPHDHTDYEKDVIWIDLGHFWNVASISQIWGLTEVGDIYYGTSDRFVQLEFSVTSGAGYDAPKFSQISVGHDNLVLATDATSGRVFRLKTHPSASHPPIWSALPGTGPGTGLHMISCTLSTADYIVGVGQDGHAYRFRHHSWICLGGGAKIETLGVGADGYVLSVDSDGDLFGCQLESTLPIIPRRVSSRGAKLNRDNKKEEEPPIPSPSSPKAPNSFGAPITPKQQSISKRPMLSPRELFEMAATDKVVRETPNRDSSISPSSPYLKSAVLQASRTNSFKGRQKLDRSDSQLSKRSYASDLATTIRYERESLKSPNLSDHSPRLSALSSPAVTDTIPLRIQTKYNPGDSYFTAKPIATVGSTGDTSPDNSLPVGGNPYSATGSWPTSSQPSSTPSEIAQALRGFSLPSSASSTPLTSTPLSSTPLQNSQLGFSPTVRTGSPGTNVTGVANFSKEEVRDDPDSIPVRSVESQSVLGRNVSSYNHNGQSPSSPSYLVRGQSASGVMPQGVTEPSKSDWSPNAYQVSNVNIADVNSYRDVNTVERTTAASVGSMRESRNEGLAIWSSNQMPLVEDKKGGFASVQTNNGNINDPYNYASSVPSLSDPRTSYSTDHSLEPPLQPWVPQLQQQQQQYSQNPRSDQGLEQFQQAKGLSSHRSSNSSDILMLQQQEFLKLTRLRSQPIASTESIVGQREPSTEKKSASDNNFDSSYSQPLQYLQQQPTGGPVSQEQPPFSNDPEKMPLYSQPDEPGATGSRPSYSSAHLQGYLNATGVGVSNTGVETNVGLRNRATNVYNPNSPLARRSGIQGEDEQGRWTGVPTVSDDRVYHYDPDVHKSKCCTIL